MVSEKQNKYIQILVDRTFSTALSDKKEALDYLTAIFFGKSYENLSVKEGIVLIEILEQAISSLWKIGKAK